jgi:hypothetical protein
MRDFQAAVSEVIACGGDTDTVAAITGALVGSRVGVQGIPARWRTSILDWPRSPALLLRVAAALKDCRQKRAAAQPISYFWPAIPSGTPHLPPSCFSTGYDGSYPLTNHILTPTPMLGIQFIKAAPTTYLLQFRNGAIVREGTGLSFFYYAPTTSLVAIPIGSSDEPFIFEETTGITRRSVCRGR